MAGSPGRKGRHTACRPSRGRLLLESLEDRSLLSGTITGLVFEDYNDNGTYDTSSTIANASTGTIGVAVDRGVAGVTVTAFDNSGNSRGTATTGTNGTYSLAASGTGPYRVVFTSMPTGMSEGQEGPNSGSTVQIVPDGNSSNVSLGLTVPTDYSSNNPLITANQYVYGDPINGAYANSPTIVGFPYSSGSQYGSTGNYAQPSAFSFTVPAKSVGATFGLGYNQATDTLYASSYTKRFAGYGPNAAGTGTTDGAVYAINPTTGSVSILADLNAIFGANTAGVNFRSLASWAGYSTDGGNTGWESVGETSLGGLAVSPDGSTVYVMNLADRNLYAIPTSGPINASTVHRVSIPFNAPGATGTNGGTQAGDLRSFAVTYYDGQLYVGIVNSAESTQNAADLKAYVYTVNPTTLAFSAAPVFQTSLNYSRAVVWTGTNSPAAWNPWSPTFKTEATGNQAIYPQPMLTGIAFDANGDMTLGIRDRDGDQSGFFTDANPAAPTTAYEGMAGGDTLQAFINTPGNLSSGWTLENDGRGPSGQGSGSQNTGDGPGDASFFYQQGYGGVHDEVTSGGVYEIPGFPDVITSAFDPGTTTVRTGGIRFLNTTTGATDKAFQIYNTGFNAPPQSTFGKAAGIGDVTAYTGVAPIEIGDRVFQDLKDDGLQDPGDPGIAGVTVHLYEGTALVGTTVTNSQGNYLFNASDVPGGLLPYTTYQVRFDNAADWAPGGALYGKVVSIPNADPAGMSGSKAIVVNGVVVINETTGAAGFVDHTLDAGFVSTGSVSGTVFNDANNDGIEDDGETGIAGVVLTLTGTNDLGAAVSATVTTDASGNYSFTGLRPSNAAGYTITETLPNGELVGKDAAGSIGGTAPAGTSVIQGIAVTPSAAGTGYTFANLLPASLAGYVYFDANDDGVKGAGELGIPGVTVTLTGTNDLGAPVNLTTTTLGDGSYSFTNLRPSNAAGYTITETRPVAYLDGMDTIGTPGGTTGTDAFSQIVLAPGVAGTSNNFGNLLPSSLSGYVYVDSNDDGTKQATEQGIPGVTVTLTGTNDLGAPVNLTTTTAADGSYTFANLRPSNAAGYTITEGPPAGYLAGKDAIGTQGGATGAGVLTGIPLASGVNGTANNFGELQPSGLAGYVYVDSSDDGIKQSGEAGIAGVTVTLTGTNDLGVAVTMTTTTSSTGAYSFTGLRPSNAAGYTITETPPAGYLAGKDTIGTPGGTTTNGQFSGIMLVSGFSGANNNFGELQPSSLSGYVYIDANNDGRKQTTEAGILGVTVTLTGVDDLGNPVNLTTTTAADGSYTFAGLRPSGSSGYTVTDIPPAAYTVDKNTVGTSGGTLVGTNSITQIGIASGTTATRYFFGESGATISGFAFVDANNDGVDDDGEAGLAGATITLLNSANVVVATTTSAADGSYSFANLPAGTYTVVETQPTGYGTSTPLSDPVTLTTSGLAGVNFGSTTSSLSGLVFGDANMNGVYDPGSDLIGPGDVVTLTGTDANGHAVNLTTTTGVDGTFTFTGLVASNPSGYTVAVAAYPGETTGTAIVGTAGGTSSPGHDIVSGIVLGAGTSASGYQYPQDGTIIQGVVYVDSNANGLLDPGEVGVGGVTITLNPQGGGAITTTTTSNGSYDFAGYPTGTYSITETVPTGYGTTTTTTLANVVVPESGVTNENFGLSASSLSGTVYNDLNNSGVLAAGDPRIAGVTINLLNASNVLVATTTTASDGTYSFANLPGGTYSIHEIQPTAYGEGQDTAGTSGGTTSTIDLISGIVLANSTASTGYNFGERGATITGEVYLDNNNNNTLDPGEAGVAGVPIQLLNASGTIIATTVSAADGTFSFANLPAGTYSTHEDRPNGYGTSTGASTNATVTLTTTGAPAVDYGLTTSTISGHTYLDLNDDGTPEAGEPPIAGVTITLIGTDALGNSVIRTTTTDVNGNYSFAGLLSGIYSVAEAQPTDYKIGLSSAGTAGGTVGTNLVVGIGLGPAIAATGYNFGSLGYPISGEVFLDANKDGVLEPGESGLAGVPLTLTLVNPANQVVATTTSAVDGTYSFPNVVAGSYTIIETPPIGYGTSTPTSVPVTVTDAGLVDENFGVTTASLSGVAFLDVNKDNAYTQGVDVPAAGLPITLTGVDVNGNPVDLTTVAGADGSFTFSSLVAGTYSLASTPYPGVNQQPVVLGTAGGTVTGLDDATGITLAAGTAATGYLFPGTGVVVSGTVYSDTNRDGMLDNSELGVPGVTVTLTGLNINTGQPVTLTTTTDANGNYVFPSAVAEQGTLAIVAPAGYAADTPTSIVTSVPLTGLANQDFGLTTASIAGTVFDDDDDNGIESGLDAGIVNVVLLLTGTDTGGHLVSLSTITGADGSYLFTGLDPGTYTVTKVPPAGYLDGIETPGSTGGTAGAETISAITVATGQASTGNNFAELLPASLAGTVYVDANDNGNKDASEVGILGVTVTLTGIDDLGDPVDLTTTTRASGNYSFTNLRPSNAAGYTITETPPAGYLDGTDNVGTQGGTLGNRSVTGIVLPAGIAGTTNNFAELAPGTVSGSVFVDANDNRADDPGEVGIAGVTITLTGTDDLGDPVDLTTTTGTNGTYSFGGLRPSGPDGYTVTETPPSGYLPGLGAATSTTSTGIVTGVNLVPGETDGGIGFPELLPASLSGYVYQDLKDVGVKVSGDPGIAGVIVTLTGTNDLGQAVDLTTTTNANGFYSFAGLRPALNDLQSGLAVGYNITETPPAGYQPGAINVGTPGGTLGTSTIGDIPLVSGFSGANNNFGELTTTSLSGFVYLDNNKDGMLDPGDAGIAGVTVTLTGVDITGHTVDVFTTTGADGSYHFTDLLPGTYSVSDVPPSDYVQGATTAGSASGTVAGNVVSGVQLGSGVAATAYNFGETGVTISGTVYADNNGDGKLDAGETGVGGVTVTLLNSQGQVVANTVTAPNGSYSFGNLPIAMYTVVETTPTGVLDTTPSTIAVCCCSGTTTTGKNFGLVAGAAISGTVYIDNNNDGHIEPGEMGIAGTTVTLTGTNNLGQPVSSTTITVANGNYAFFNLLPGVYTLTGSTVPSYADGKDTAGTAGGTVLPGDMIGGIAVGAGTIAYSDNFGKVGSTLAGTITVAGSPEVGATVTVNEGGKIVGTGTTGPGGIYIIPGLPSGPATITAVMPIPGGSPSIQTTTMTLPAGSPGVANFDVPGAVTGSISGFVYDDLYDAGFKGGADPGIPAVLMTLGGTDLQGNPVYRQVYTAADGSYSFTGLPAGNYNILEGAFGYFLDGKVTAGSLGGNASTHLVKSIPLGAGGSGVNYDFGHLAPSTVSGFVYDDLYDSGFKGGADPGIPAVLMTLGGTDLQGNPVYRQVYTAADGSYSFTGLPAGNYNILEGAFGYFLDGKVTAGSLGGNASTHLVKSIPLGAGGSGVNYDFGHLAPSAITGTVYIDANQNGFDNNDFGLAHIPVVLQGHDLQGDPVSMTTVTGSNGTYSFANLMPGFYNVTADRLTQYFNAGADNPGTAGGTGRGDTISTIPLGAGTIDSAYNFGEDIRKGCVLALPQVNALVRYGPHPGGVPASLLKGVSIPPGSVTAYYVPTLAAEVNDPQPSVQAESVAAGTSTPVPTTVQVGVDHPSVAVTNPTSKSKSSSLAR